LTIGQSTILTLTGNRATGEAYTLAHHLTTDGGKRRLMVAALRYSDQFVKTDGTWVAQRYAFFAFLCGFCWPYPYIRVRSSPGGASMPLFGMYAIAIASHTRQNAPRMRHPVRCSPGLAPLAHPIRPALSASFHNSG
jgi:hypothetical protein